MNYLSNYITFFFFLISKIDWHIDKIYILIKDHRAEIFRLNTKYINNLNK